jgi:hypothetical protein
VNERDFAHGAAGLTDLNDQLIKKTDRSRDRDLTRPRGGDGARSWLPGFCHQHTSPSATISWRRGRALPRVRLQPGAFDAGDRASFVIIGRVAADADRAEQCAAVHD